MSQDVDGGYPFDLGSYHRDIQTPSEEAQAWFNRGLVWSYGFNHEESADCFRKAIEHDPKCKMAFWGLVYALGPNYNKPWEGFTEDERKQNLETIHTAIREANQTVDQTDTDSVEQALWQAVQYRYPFTTDDDFSIWNTNYALRMSLVHSRFPDDLDVATLCADALMNLTPWALWDLKTGEPDQNAHTTEIRRILDRAIALPGGAEHPGLLHLKIHLMEMSPTPEDGLAAADRLRALVPDAGHLNHMPSHLDILCGDYASAILANTAAIAADEKYLSLRGAGNFYTLYRCHDYHFRLYAAMFAAQSHVALETVSRLEASLTEAVLRHPSPPLADWLEGFLSARVHVLVRFGKWAELLALAPPRDRDLYSVTAATLYYGQGVATAARRERPLTPETAESLRARFHSARRRVPESRTIFNNRCADILKVAGAMLEGELQFRLGRHEEGFEALRDAIRLSDEMLVYDEPWGWMQPPRHAYGALLMERGRVREAARVYAADLGFDDTLPRACRHPKNVWALRGYLECLTSEGFGADPGEVERVGEMFREAETGADIRVRSSCLCSRADGNEAT